jgi:hypothetical protein
MRPKSEPIIATALIVDYERVSLLGFLFPASRGVLSRSRRSTPLNLGSHNSTPSLTATDQAARLTGLSSKHDNSKIAPSQDVDSIPEPAIDVHIH